MIELKEVKTRKQRKEFVDYPNELYRDNPNYIPGFYSDSLASITPEKNKAFNCCEARFWLAKCDGRTVGRIGAIINHRANDKWNKKQMRFWNVDFIDDESVSAALFDVVEQWAREKGCTEIAGPLGFTDLDPEGLLIDGFDERGLFVTYYNYPYYSRHLAALGFEKDADWVEYQINCPREKEPYAKLIRMSDQCLKGNNLHVKKIGSLKELDRIASDVMKLINTTYADLYGTSELDEEQRAAYVKSFRYFIDRKTSIAVYDEQEELIGFAVTIADISGALKKSNGKLFPAGWLRLLKAVKKNDEYIGLLIGIRPEYRYKGVIIVLLTGLLHEFVEKGVKTIRMCPMLEDNSRVLGLTKAADSRVYKRRRSFVKHLLLAGDAMV